MAITHRRKSSSSKVLAKNTKEAKQKLHQEGLTPLKLTVLSKTNKGNSKTAKESGEKPVKRSPLARGSQKGEKLGLEFLKRLHELHSSGMPVAESVKLLNLRLSDPYQKEIAGSLWKELAEGRTCLLSTSPRPGDKRHSRRQSSA